MTACNSPTIQEPIDSCVTSKKFQLAKCGKRILDYKQQRESVGEWKNVNDLTVIPQEEMPDMVCVSLPDWLLKVKPKLKEGHDFWLNTNRGNQ